MTNNRITEAAETAKGDAEALYKLLLICADILEGEGDYTVDGNCEEDCTWDGVSRRCRCNNRRVCWAYDLGTWRPECY